jgi:hypothetical protein
MQKLISIVLRTMAGLKATYSERSLKPGIYGAFTLKISKNGHFWGLAKMAPPCDSPRSGFHRGEKTRESKPATGAERIVLPCGGGCRVCAVRKTRTVASPRFAANSSRSWSAEMDYIDMSMEEVN